MNKTLKTALILLSSTVASIIVSSLLIGALFNSAFNSERPKIIATYSSPDSRYSLIFEQMGEPQWPFGATEVRLTLKNRDDKIIECVSAQLSDDGANASERNIASLSWNDDSVTVVLRASEMEDKKISIAYNSQHS